MTIFDYFITISFLLIEAFFITYLVTSIVTLINKDSSNKGIKNFIILFVIIFMTFLINKLIHIFLPKYMVLKSIIFIIAISLGCLWQYKTKVLKSIIVAVICSTLSAIIEVIIILLLKHFNIDPMSIVNNSLKISSFSCVIAATQALIGVVINFTSHSLATIDNKLKYFIPNFIAIVICLFSTMMLLILNDFKFSKSFIFTNILQLITISFVGLFNLNFVAKHENLKLQLSNTLTYNQTLKKVNDGVRGFKHDMGNIVQAILGYIAINDAEGAKHYCQNLVIGFNDINVLSILSPKLIDDPAIYGVVANKILMAREKNMKLSLDVSTSICEINFPKFELSRILGILLDNAIEASENTVDKKLIINIFHDYKCNADIIIISNSITDTNINIGKIFTKNYSTKEKPSGFGLYEVNKFINKHPQSNINTSIDKVNRMFTQKLTIYK